LVEVVGELNKVLLRLCSLGLDIVWTTTNQALEDDLI
jgi:hypothetical protein